MISKTISNVLSQYYIQVIAVLAFVIISLIVVVRLQYDSILNLNIELSLKDVAIKSYADNEKVLLDKIDEQNSMIKDMELTTEDLEKLAKENEHIKNNYIEKELFVMEEIKKNNTIDNKYNLMYKALKEFSDD